LEKFNIKQSAPEQLKQPAKLLKKSFKICTQLTPNTVNIAIKLFLKKVMVLNFVLDRVQLHGEILDVPKNLDLLAYTARNY